jgi:adenylate cyclase
MFQLMVGAEFVRIKATDDDIPGDCDWMLKENYSELYGLPATPGGTYSLENAASGQLEGGFTWTTKAEGGFTDAQLEVLNKTVFALATVLRLYIMRFTSRFLLMTYLGEDAGTRVHQGEIERGEGLTIRSAIWFSDVRGFTEMSGELHRGELIDMINGVFEITQKIVRKHNGQVLKFMGDGCMAIFTSSTSTFQRTSFTLDEKRELDDCQGAQVCRRARLAAAEVQECLKALKKERESKGLRGASIGIGLHYGDISYGNVGAPDRLDFTVLGPHVNLASRTESLCGKLSAKVLATADFVKLDGDADAWKSRGEHNVKGVIEPIQVFELNGMVQVFS